MDALKPKMLVTGLGDSVQGFEALPNVEREVNLVHDLMGEIGFSMGAFPE